VKCAGPACSSRRAEHIGSDDLREVASLVMVDLWNRIPVWADWVVAAIAAIVVLNLNVTTGRAA
jgi:hypothetical protein